MDDEIRLEKVIETGVPVSIFADERTLGTMEQIVDSLDFMQETEVMLEVGYFPAWNLLVYDDVLALGLYSTNESLGVGMRPYSQQGMMDWIDKALAEWGTPIRVVDKTTVPGEFARRLAERTNCEWVEYDPKTQVLREKPGAKCTARKQLEAAFAFHPFKEVYAVSPMPFEESPFTHVVHLELKDQAHRIGQYQLEGIRCEGEGTDLPLPLEKAETQLKEMHPEAVVLRQPLMYCNQLSPNKPFSCIACHFEKAYAEKVLGWKDQES
jgi:hypothetical protein